MRITVRHLKSIITEALAAPKGYDAALSGQAAALTITVEVDKGSK